MLQMSKEKVVQCLVLLEYEIKELLKSKIFPLFRSENLVKDSITYILDLV